jgi:hypothetical protein
MDSHDCPFGLAAAATTAAPRSADSGGDPAGSLTNSTED